MHIYTGNTSYFVRGQQNVVDPNLNYWDGRNGGTNLFIGIRNCNTFLDNINSVPDMDQMEKDQWSSEVKFLKAYYLYYLVRNYGPIPLMKKNLPIDADITEIRDRRQPVDSCFSYIEALLNESIEGLQEVPLGAINSTDYGRITKPIAMSLKALVLVTAASSLFNGNTDYADYTDEEYGPLFNQQYAPEKWEKAMIAAREAIETCEALEYSLYKYEAGPGQVLSDVTLTQMSIRNAVADREMPRVEVIWPFTGAWATQTNLTPQTWDPANNYSYMQGRYGPPLNVVNLFYTENGVPIDEDKTWDYNGRFEIRTGTEAEKYNIFKGYQTAAMHFNREARFYASTGFDGGIWYGQGKFDDNDTWHLEGRAGGYTSAQLIEWHTPTGYWPKKLINFKNTVDANAYRLTAYQFPIMRLADLYLLYSEAANEFSGPSQQVYLYLNKIRERAGLPDFEDAWNQFSNRPDKYQNKDGLREIIHREREVELIYESKRYWDLLRWKKAEQVLSEPVLGWSIRESSPEMYYTPIAVFQGKFNKREYFFPIREASLLQNGSLLQSPGW